MTQVLNRLACLALATLLVACAGHKPAVRSVPASASASASASAPVNAASAIAAWARVLDRFVDERGRTDFAALARDRADLDRYLAFVDVHPAQGEGTPAQKLAHMINAYNALVMGRVIERGIPATHAGWNKLLFFVLGQVPVGGRSMSLRAFENDVIRPYARQLADPRIHFALNCAALSCPQLPRRPFDASTLEADLTLETRRFFARPENFRVDTATRTVWLSEILEFFPEDFVPVPASSLLAYANRYAPAPAPADFAVRFTPYDWTVATPRAVAR